MSIFAFLIQVLAGYMSFHLYVAFNSVLAKGPSFAIMFVCLVLGESFFLLMISEFRFGIRYPGWIIAISFLCMVMSFYLVMLYAVSDVLRLTGLYPEVMKNYRFVEMLVLAGTAAIIVLFGYFNARNVKMKEINVTAAKPVTDFSILFLSDLHLGSGTVTAAALAKAVDRANARNPDFIILGGDIVDNYIGVIRTEGYDEHLRRLRAKYGVYAVLGNHEYYRNSINDVITTYQDLGMTVLRDESVTVQPLGVELIGLDDRTAAQRGNVKLSPVKNLINGDGFKVVVSHNPVRQEEAVAAGSDLFLAGHTHSGQLFPMNFILKFMYQTVWGYARFDNTHVYVSSGMGVWGPPVRVGSDAEMVFLQVKSK